MSRERSEPGKECFEGSHGESKTGDKDPHGEHKSDLAYGALNDTPAPRGI